MLSSCKMYYQTKEIMKLITLNCNGIRSAKSKGLFDYIKKEKADMLAFQEIKAEESQTNPEFFEELGYHPFVFSAEKKGYSGTAIFTKQKPKSHTIGIGHKLFDREGRSILLEFKNFAFINTYFPSGTSGNERQAIKMEFLDYYINKKSEWEKKYKKLIICGDVNIAHTEIDIHNPKGNEKNSGFLPEERQWVTEFLASGMVDVFRVANPDKLHEYSWWTYRFNARKNNKGWRIDYFFTTKNLTKNIRSCKIDQSLIVSDHAPVVLEIDI